MADVVDRAGRQVVEDVNAVTAREEGFVDDDDLLARGCAVTPSVASAIP